MTQRSILLEQLGPADLPLGRNIEHDERSKNFPAKMSSQPLTSVFHHRHTQAYWQGDLGSCTGNAIAGLCMTDPFWKVGWRLGEGTAVRFYKWATSHDAFIGEYPPDDTGSSGLAAAKAAVHYGRLSGYSHAFGIEQALAALQIAPVITGVKWYAGMDAPDADGIVTRSGPIRGGHEFEVTGYDHVNRFVQCYNSWGLNWGIKGKFWMTVETWDELLQDSGDVTTGRVI